MKTQAFQMRSRGVHVANTAIRRLAKAGGAHAHHDPLRVGEIDIFLEEQHAIKCSAGDPGSLIYRLDQEQIKQTEPLVVAHMRAGMGMGIRPVSVNTG